MEADAKESALKSKIRAASYLGGKSNFRKLFLVYDTDGSGELEYAEFEKAMRRDGRVSKRHLR